MPIVYKEKSGAVRNRKQQPPAQPGTCIWGWARDSPWVSEPGAACQRRLQGGGRRGDAVRSGPKTGNPRNIWLLCMFTSFLCRFLPSVLQHLTFYFCIGHHWFNCRSRGDPVVAGGGRGGASGRAGKRHSGSLVENCFWGRLNLQKTKDVVFTSRHSSSVVLEHGLLKISQMNLFSSEACYLLYKMCYLVLHSVGKSLSSRE